MAEHPPTNGELRKLSDAVLVLQSGYAGLKSDIDQLASGQAEVLRRIEAQAEASRPNYFQWITALFGGFALLTTMVGGAYFVITLQVANALSPVVTASEVSERDRGTLHAEVRQIANTVSTLGSDLEGSIEGNRAKLIEIETQFCAADSIREGQRLALLAEIDSLRRELKLEPLSDRHHIPQVGRCGPAH